MLGVIERRFRSWDGRISASTAERSSDGIFQIAAIRRLRGHGDLNRVHALLHLLRRECRAAFALFFDRGDGLGGIHHRRKLHAGLKRAKLVKRAHVRVRHASGHDGLIHAVGGSEVLAAARLAVSPARHAADEAAATFDVVDQSRAFLRADHALRIDDDDIVVGEVLFLHRGEFLTFEAALGQRVALHAFETDAGLRFVAHPLHAVFDELRVITAAIAAEVSILAKQDDAPLSIRRSRSDRDFNAILVRRGQDRKRDLPPNAHRTRRTELWHRFDAFEDFRAFGIHERWRHLSVQNGAGTEEADQTDPREKTCVLHGWVGGKDFSGKSRPETPRRGLWRY